jgi:hypothetical protein
VGADAAGVLEKPQICLGYSYITDFFPVFEFVSPKAFSFSHIKFFFNNCGRNVSISLNVRKY